MIKYKVSEVAKDLNVPSKAVIEAIKECCGVTKKSGNVLTDQELNVVFEYFTQKNQVENFDKYYASRDSEPEKAEKADKPAKAKDENGEVIQAGEISVDFIGKKPGRGAYICRSNACLASAKKARRLERAFSCKISEEIYNKLEEEFSGE